MKVLICDDEKTNRKLLTRKMTKIGPFRDLGWDVTSCSKGEDVLEKILVQKEVFDVIVLVSH